MEFHFVCSLVKPWKMGTMLKDFQISTNDSFSSNKQLNRSFFSISILIGLVMILLEIED